MARVDWTMNKIYPLDPNSNIEKLLNLVLILVYEFEIKKQKKNRNDAQENNS